KRKRLDCEFDEISVSRPFKYHKGGYFEEEYDQEGWFIGHRYRGDKADYVCREDTDDEVDKEVCSGCLAQYGDGDGENSSEHEGANYEEEYCAEGWFIGYKYKGDKAGYVSRQDTNEADYSDEESSNGDFVKKDVNQDYTEDKAKEMCTEFEKMMHKKFQMSSMGELTSFLGLQVTQKDDGIFLSSQDKYVHEILKKFGFSTVKTSSTHMETSKPLMKDKNAEDVDVHLYR
nr:ribonuclease H-like domain-containing protein [Tanacetum cinerariifolium]